MDSFREVENLWHEFYELPFPSGLAEEKIKGIDLYSLDTFTAGCIDTFIVEKTLDKNRIKILENCQKELEIVVKYVNEEAKNYFNKLLYLTNQVLQKTNSNNFSI